MRPYSPGGMLKALAAPLVSKPTNGWLSSFTAWTTRVSNPVCSPRCRASVSVEATFRSHCPADRLRHWCSSGSLRIPPLHPEFHLPLQCPSPTVAAADLGLSPRLSPRPYGGHLRALYAQ